MQWHLIDSVTLEKPRQGLACNGCGACCIAKVCELGAELGDEINCRALLHQADGSFQCGMVVDPYRFMAEEDLDTWKFIDSVSNNSAGEDRLKAMHAEMLGAGRGCDSDDEAIRESVEEAKAFRQITLPFE